VPSVYLASKELLAICFTGHGVLAVSLALDFNDAAVLVIKKGAAVWSAVGYFLDLPYLLLFDICFCGMKPAIFFPLQEEKFILIIRNNIPMEKIALDRSFFVIDIDDVHFRQSL
jgi:hypothetical protein